jgi:lysophospholipase L1-like esterase
MKPIHRTFLLFACLGLFTAIAQSAAIGPSPYPDPQDDTAWPGQGPIRLFPSWMPELRAKFWAQRDADQGKIVFTGDSIIAGWKLENDFAGKPVANRGIGGDVTRGLLFRLKEDILDLHPKAIVIHIGGNDLSADAEVEAIVSNYRLVIKRIRESDPEVPVLILAVLPRGIPTGDPAMTPERAARLKKVYACIAPLNSRLRALATALKNVIYIDSYSLFLLPNGSLDTSLYSADLVHPTAAGRSKLGIAVAAVLSKMNLI